MARSWEHIRQSLSMILTSNQNICPDAFHETFTPQNFADTIFSLIVSSFIQETYDSGTILEIIRRTVYASGNPSRRPNFFDIPLTAGFFQNKPEQCSYCPQKNKNKENQLCRLLQKLYLTPSI